ncbi:MAG: hypothetical protein ACRCZO_17825, partial [Cetobacterium sp.]
MDDVIIGDTANTESSSCKSGQQRTTHVSPKRAVERSKCIDHGKQRRENKSATLRKWDQTCLDSSKKKKQVQTESKLTHVSKLQDNLMDDVIIGDTVNTDFSFKPLTSADQD